MKKITSIFLMISMIALFSCESGGSKKSTSAAEANNPKLREVVVTEILQTSSYTYIKFEEEGSENWGAIPRRDDLAEGKTYYFDAAMEMKNFPSKELDRTFESVYFIESISDKPITKDEMVVKNTKGSPQVGNMEVEAIETVEGGISIGELYKNKEKYAGKKVKIHGMVVKFTAAVMEKNWVHVQDGTEYGGDLDITITTIDVVDINDVVTFEGTVILDKDFGYGYQYDILIEDAKVLDVDHSAHM